MSTRYSCRRGLELFAAAALSLATLLSTAVPRPAIAATDVKTLVTQAIHNTNTVNTIVHHDQTTVVSGSSHLQETASGSEDEVRNLEQDSEVVTATAKGSNGKAQTVHYTLDVIFIKGYTYYRSSLQKNQWTRRKGTTLTDPVTNGVFKRARTKVTAPQGFKLGSYSLVGTSAGLTQVRAPLTRAKAAGTWDLWISGGSTPYIMREEIHAHATGGGKGSEYVRTDYGPFNKPVTIAPPITTGGTT